MPQITLKWIFNLIFVIAATLILIKWTFNLEDLKEVWVGFSFNFDFESGPENSRQVAGMVLGIFARLFGLIGLIICWVSLFCREGTSNGST